MEFAGSSTGTVFGPLEHANLPKKLERRVFEPLEPEPSRRFGLRLYELRPVADGPVLGCLSLWASLAGDRDPSLSFHFCSSASWPIRPVTTRVMGAPRRSTNSTFPS